VHLIGDNINILFKWLNSTHTAIKALRAGRTSNIERRIMMTLRFVYFKTSEPHLAMSSVKSNFEGWFHFAGPLF